MTLAFRGLNLTQYNDPTRSQSWASLSRNRVRRGRAMDHSAVWAATSLRANLISTLPVDCYRQMGSLQVDFTPPTKFVSQDGGRIDFTEWMYDTQIDLDTVGNTIGLITEVDGFGLPARIDLVPRDQVDIQVRKGAIKYRISGIEVDASKVWHERQYTVSGLAVGLSPVAAAAMALYQFESAQEFAANWFAGGAIPTGVLKNEATKLDPAETEAAKGRFRLAVESGDLLVYGKDWDYKPIEAQQSQASFIDTMQFTDIAMARFFGVTADAIDAAVQGSSILYSNVTQANLQLLVRHLGAPIIRREKALSRWLPDQRFVKLNTDALLRMDPQTVAEVLASEVKSFLRAPDEAREKLNLSGLTEANYKQFERLGLTRVKDTPDKPGSTK